MTTLLLDDMMTKEQIWKEFQSKKGIKEKLKYINMMRECFPKLYNINWDSVEKLTKDKHNEEMEKHQD